MRKRAKPSSGKKGNKKGDKTSALTKLNRLIPFGYWVIALLKFLLDFWSATR